MPRNEFAGGAAATTLAGSIGSSDLTFTVANAQGWPTGAVGQFTVTVNRGTSGEERVLCAARSENVFTVAQRGYDGTTALAHAGGTVEHTVSGAAINDLVRHRFTVADDDHLQYSRTNGTRAFTGVPAGAPPVASTPGDTQATGSALTIANSLHRHAREAPGGVASNSFVGDAQAAGVSPTLARSDHRHGRESFGAPVGTGTAPANGVLTTLPRSDHVHKGGRIICTSTTRPASPVEGDAIAETDTDRLLVYSGTAWVRTGWWSSAGRTGWSGDRSSIGLGGGGFGFINWNSETFDSDNIFTPDGLNTQLTMPVDGLYAVSVRGQWDTIINERHYVQIDATGPGDHRFIGTGDDLWSASAVIPLVAGSQIGIILHQNSVALRTFTAHLDVYRIGA